MKKALLAAMIVVFCIFIITLTLGFGRPIAGVNLSIVTALVLIFLFLGFIMVSEKEKKRGGDRS